MEMRRRSEDGEELGPLLRGWCLGSQAFRKELLAQMTEKRGSEHLGTELRESAEEKANRLIKEELRKLQWSESALEKHLEGHPHKVRIALRLRKETTMTLPWIAERFRMGTKTHLSHLLYWNGKKK